MEFEWLNSENAMPIGLKGNDCYFELTIFEYENKKYPLVSNMYGSNRSDLYELIVNVIANIEKKIELKDGDKLLEIGCGWGGFAEIAAKEYGCQVTALTLSKEQASSCKKRAINTGIEKSVDIRLEDYRDVRGLYDKIVSIEMLEAVGEKFWRRYFESVRDRLAPGGKAAIQTITIKDDCFESYKRNPDFIQQFIFLMAKFLN